MRATDASVRSNPSAEMPIAKMHPEASTGLVQNRKALAGERPKDRATFWESPLSPSGVTWLEEWL